MTYSSVDMVDAVQSNRPHTIDGKEVETKRATPIENAGESGKSVKKVFVGGLKDDIDDDDIKAYFGSYGTVVKVEQMADKASGKKRGFGFVEFEDYDSVDKMMQVPRHQIKDRRIDLRKAMGKNEMGGGGGSYGGGRGGRNAGGPSPWGGQGGYGGGFGNNAGGYGGASYGGAGGWGGSQGGGYASNPWQGGNSWGASQGNGWSNGASGNSGYMTGEGGWGGGYGSGNAGMSSGGGAMRNSMGGANRSMPYTTAGGRGGRGGRGGGGAGRWQ